jgi:ketosteroid isomerase-like protein
MRSRRLLSVAVLLFMLLFVGDALSSTERAETRDGLQENAIRQARARWNRAVAKRDTTVLRTLWSETYHFVGGTGQISGPEAAVAAVTRLFAQRPDVFFEAQPTRIRVAGDHGLASEFGTWVERWRDSSGLTELRGTYYVLWRRHQADVWLMEAEVNVPEACTGSDYCKPR